MVGFCILLGGTYKAYRPTHLSAHLAVAVARKQPWNWGMLEKITGGVEINLLVASLDDFEGTLMNYM